MTINTCTIPLAPTATLYVHRQSAYLIGRDRRVRDYFHFVSGVHTCLPGCGRCTGGGYSSGPPLVFQSTCSVAVQTCQLREERWLHRETCQVFVYSDLCISFTRSICTCICALLCNF